MRGGALDDPAAEPATELEREVGPAGRADALGLPAEQLLAGRAGPRQIAGVQLQVHNRVVCHTAMTAAGAGINQVADEFGAPSGSN